MKLRCDVCDQADADVFCSADEAALCSRCDGSVHHANKLASRHQRFSLVVKQAEEDVPPCDACQERRAFMFCQQDRAILCGECDLSLHTANANKHNRFVLTGLMLSNCLQTCSISEDEFGDAVPEGPPASDQSQSNTANSKSPPSSAASSAKSVDVGFPSAIVGDGFPCSSSFLSQYLMETLPGWQVEELLESCSATSGALKNVDVSEAPVVMGISTVESSGVSSGSLGFWVPQAAPSGLYPTKAVEEAEQNPSMGTRNCHKRWKDDVFTVPKIDPDVIASCKRNSNRNRSGREWE